MSARGGAFVVLFFAAVWLWVGASALPSPFNVMVGIIGLAVLAAVGWHVLRQPAPLGSTRRFERRKFWAAVAFEVIAANAVAFFLGKNHLLGYLWPAFGIVVALHFIGLWWATGDKRFIALTVGMTAINIVALFFPQGSPASLAISGLGSSAALAAALVRR